MMRRALLLLLALLTLAACSSPSIPAGSPATRMEQFVFGEVTIYTGCRGTDRLYWTADPLFGVASITVAPGAKDCP